MESDCKFIMVEDLSRWHKHKVLREGESSAISGNGIQAEELANANALRDEGTWWVQGRSKVSEAGG